MVFRGNRGAAFVAKVQRGGGLQKIDCYLTADERESGEFYRDADKILQAPPFPGSPPPQGASPPSQDDE